MKRILALSVALLLLFGLIACAGNRETPPEDEELFPGAAHTAVPASVTPMQATWNGEWYGLIWILSATGAYADEEGALYDARIVIDIDSYGKGSLAIFVAGEEDSTVSAKLQTVESYIQTTEGMFWDMPLHADMWWLVLSTAHEGRLVYITETYIDPENPEQDGFQYQFRFRPYGELWEGELRNNDLVPPGYHEYVAALGGAISDPGQVVSADTPEPSVQTETAAPTVQANSPEPPAADDPFGFSSDPSVYRTGECGWMYNLSGTMRMRIPPGWEIENALHETTIAVRSHMGGDMIRMMIRPYMSVLPEKTPENQVRQNYSTAEIIKDKWGNTEVWYRITEMTDWVTIFGCAAFDEENCIQFEIRRQKASGSIEEFLQSEAWNTLRTTFELVIP
ncbi:MAG: hypothetical protein FWF10_11185 [Clostridiales bacterium]|nr:hypothetical protein [Clostridiales bacterium]